MRHRDYLQELVELHRVDDDDKRRNAWRQGMATLASAVADHGRSVPLEGYDPDALLRSVTIATQTRLIDDLEWLSAPAAAAALYELASALPPSNAKRDLGRRVLRLLHRGDAATFVALATQLALTSPKALSGTAIRARVALCLDLPIGSGSRADTLALALISRQELSREWLERPSTGSLPSRRLAARLLERAAREAAQRAERGDDSGVRVFETPLVQQAWQRLLGDRESLVWRHVASARGLLSAARPSFEEEIHENLETSLGMTEWRRAAASLAASIAVRPDEGLRLCRQVLASAVFQGDPGIPAAMLFGLPRAAEAQPHIVEDLLEQLVVAGGLAAAEALVDLRREQISEGFGDWAARRARAAMETRLTQAGPQDDGKIALAQAVMEELNPDEPQATLRDLVSEALRSFVTDGATTAGADAFAALEAAGQRVAILERCIGDGDREQRSRAFAALRELDLALLESDTLANLLSLGGDEQRRERLRPLGDLFQRLTNWLVIHEGNPITEPTIEHFTLRMRRLRALLHLVDADGRRVDDRQELLRQRRTLTAQILLGRVQNDRPSPLRRALCAAASRASDALVRMDVAEVSDIVLAAGRTAQNSDDILTMAEASMVPELEDSLSAYAELEQCVAGATPSSSSVRASVISLRQLAHGLPIASSPRVEALRSALLGYGQALEHLSRIHSLAELEATSAGDTHLAELEDATQLLSQLVLGGKRRIGELLADSQPLAAQSIRLLDIHLERKLLDPEASVAEALDGVVAALHDELPRAIAEVGSLTITRLANLPVHLLDGPPESIPPIAAPKANTLPNWMPPSRTLGGFYVTRAIGNGAVGSVFVAKRSEARRDTEAENFALKVPEYSGAVARTLSEDEFLQLFRQEAGALLALPRHSNLARFVTFDAGAQPKPILVMELVEGPSLERLLELRKMNMGRALHLLQGIADGIAAMHTAGVAHLDVKPSNIIVRDADKGPGDPVLVDFGLAGRTLRLGCGTASYGAPEVWGHDVSGLNQAPPADVYAFGCLAFELLTGRPLFDEDNDIATITAHLQHDGFPASVGRLSTDPRTAGFAELVRRSIRRDPRERVTIHDLSGATRRVAPALTGLQWPIQA